MLSLRSSWLPAPAPSIVSTFPSPSPSGPPAPSADPPDLWPPPFASPAARCRRLSLPSRPEPPSPPEPFLPHRLHRPPPVFPAFAVLPQLSLLLPSSPFPGTPSPSPSPSSTAPDAHRAPSPLLSRLSRLSTFSQVRTRCSSGRDLIFPSGTIGLASEPRAGYHFSTRLAPCDVFCLPLFFSFINRSPGFSLSTSSHPPEPTTRHRAPSSLPPWRRSSAQRPSAPAVPACAAGRARPSASTRTAGRRARTAPRACTSAISRPSPWATAATACRPLGCSSGRASLCPPSGPSRAPRASARRRLPRLSRVTPPPPPKSTSSHFFFFFFFFFCFHICSCGLVSAQFPSLHFHLSPPPSRLAWLALPGQCSVPRPPRRQRLF